MNGVDFVCDTNLLIKLVSGDKDVQDILQGKLIFVSFISEMELLSWPEISIRETALIKAMLSQFTVLPLHEQTKQEAIILRRHTRMKLPDAIVAATAIVKGIPLLTSDKGFNKAKDLLEIVIV